MITISTICAFAVRDARVLDTLGAALRSDLVVADPNLRTVMEYADDFLTKYGQVPSPGSWAIWTETIDAKRAEGLRSTLSRLFAQDVDGYQAEHFADRVLPELKKAAARTAVTRLQATGDPDPASLKRLTDEVEKIGLRSLSGLAHLSDIETWADMPLQEDRLSTGFPTLDETVGGWGPELWMVFADSGVGKSMILQNWSASAAAKGARVLHVTLELGLRPQIHRYYRQIAQAARAEFKSNLLGVKSRLSHWMKFAQGEIHLIEFPAYSLEPDELRRVVDRVSRTLGDIGFVTLDYLDLMSLPKGSGGRSGYEELGMITHKVRSVCTEFDIPVLTASQAVRRPGNAARLSLKDMGDSYQKVRGADGILSLVQTEEEAEVHQGRLGILKVRDGSGMGREIPLYINRELAVIQELDHPNTRELMRRLGHLPSSSTPAGLRGVR